MVMLQRHQECDGGIKHERMKRPRPRRNERRVTMRPGPSKPLPRQSAARREHRPGDLLEGERVAARHVAHGRGHDVHLAARD